MQELDTCLVFREDSGPTQGFTNLHANRDQTKDDIVIRELLQNSLDAGKGPKKVNFYAKNFLLDDIPFMREYQRAFEYSREHCEKDEPPTGKQIIQRIDSLLSSKNGRLQCLICSDNGSGISSEDLRSLYSSGRSTKLSSGRGSVGHGHLTAFAPSDLRYVLYAGRRGDGGNTFGGHALLATHIIYTEGGADNRRQQRSFDGFIRNAEDAAIFDEESGGTVIPEPLCDYLHTDHGSAVMIVGYRPISNAKPCSLADLILSAAARHFLVAVNDRILEVGFTSQNDPEEVTDKTAANTSSLSSTMLPKRFTQPADVILNHSSMEACIEKIKSIRERRVAERTLHTLRHHDSQLPRTVVSKLGAGVRIWFRNQLRPEEPRTRVSIFRDGMWIEDNTKGRLQPRHFSEVEPFDAVVDLDSSEESSFGHLVREAEGASHLHISPKEIVDRNRQRELINKLGDLREILVSQATPSDPSQDYEPPELKLLGAVSYVGTLPKARPPRSEPKATGPKEAPQEKPVSPGDPLGPGDDHALEFNDNNPNTPEGGNPTVTGNGNLNEEDERERRKARERVKTDEIVKAGNSTGLSSSCRPDMHDAGVFHISWVAVEGKLHGGDLGLRLILPSGTDWTSRRKIEPEYLAIVPMSASGGSLKRVKGFPKEIRVTRPEARGSAIVRIDPVHDGELQGADLSLIAAEPVHRSSRSVVAAS